MAFDTPLKATVVSEILTKINDNVSQDITPAELREVLNSCLDYAEQAANSDNITQGSTNKFAAAAATEAESEAGTETALRSFSPLHVGKAIEALQAINVIIDTPLITSAMTFSDKIYLLNLSIAAAFLPPASPSSGDQFGIIDATRSFSSSVYCQIRFASAGVKFHGNNVNINIQKQDASVVFEYVNTTTGWVIIRGSIT